MNFLSLILLQLGLILGSTFSNDYEGLTFVTEDIQNLGGSDSIVTVEIGKGSGIYFTYPVNSVKLIMQPCDSLNPQDDWYCPEPVYSRTWRIGEWKGPATQPGFTIYFSPGPSADPEFIFVNKKGGNIGYIAALKLRIQSDLMIHSSGHSNTMFDKRRMFKIQKDTIQEVRQPFYQVGLTGILLRDIKLFSDENFRQIQQTIHAGEEVEIMFALPAGKDEPYERIYILRTESGMIGYLRIENEDTFGGLMAGFFYAGD
jgi:hypothetical protein